MNRKVKEMIGGCCVCSDERGWSENPLVYCDGTGCNVAVHQACYGIVQVPTGPWFCKKCESQERAVRVKCELCPQRDGALKRTNSGGWCHVVCALYIPEAWFANVQTMEPIVLSSVPPDRFNKTCYICEEQKRDTKATAGACMQCNRNGCKQYFHVTCAQAQGLLCEVTGSYENVKYCGYCTYHYKKLKNLSNVKTIPAFRPIPNDSETPDSSPEKNPPQPTQPIQPIQHTEEKQNSTANKEVKSPPVDQSVSSTSDSLPPLQLPNNKPESTAMNPALVRTYSDVSDVSSAFSPATEAIKSPCSDQIQEPSSSVGTPAQKSPTPTLTRMLQEGSATSSTENLFDVDSVTSGALSLEKGAVDKKEDRKSQVDTVPHVTSKRPRATSMDKGAKSGNKKTKSHVTSSVTTSTSGNNSKEPTKKTGMKKARHHSGSSAKPAGSISSTQTSLPGHHDYCGSVFGGSPYFQSLSAPGHVSMSTISSTDAEHGSSKYVYPPKIFPSAQKEFATNNVSQHFPLTMEHLLEQQWEQGAQFLMEQGDHFNISSLLNCLHHLKGENQQLEDQVKELSDRRDHLMAVNARLALPLSFLDSTPPMTKSFSMGSLEDISSPDDVQTPKFESPLQTFPKVSNPNLKVEDNVSPMEADRPVLSTSILRPTNDGSNVSSPFVFSDKICRPPPLMYSVINPPPLSLCTNVPSTVMSTSLLSSSSAPSSSSSSSSSVPSLEPTLSNLHLSYNSIPFLDKPQSETSVNPPQET